MDSCCLCGLKVENTEQLEFHVEKEHWNIFWDPTDNQEQALSTKLLNQSRPFQINFNSPSETRPDDNEPLLARQAIENNVIEGKPSTFARTTEPWANEKEQILSNKQTKVENVAQSFALQSNLKETPKQAFQTKVNEGNNLAMPIDLSPTLLIQNSTKASEEEGFYLSQDVDKAQQQKATLKTARLKGFKKCSSCDFTTDSNKVLLEHQIKTHIALHLYTVSNPGHVAKNRFENNSTQDVANPKKKFPSKICEICKKYFKNGAALSRHNWRVHTDHGVLTCNLCQQTFASHSSLYSHKKKVHEGQKWECQDCPKIFSSKFGLQIHILSCHSGNNKRTCIVCNKTKAWNAFKEKNVTLNVNNEKQYTCLPCVKVSDGFIPARVICSTCNKSYKNKAVLKLHQFEVHVNNRHFPCPLCQKIFTCKSSVYSHVKVFHGTKKWNCDQCGKAHGNKMLLERHKISLHSKNNKGFCFQCEKILSFILFAKKNMKIVDGLKVSICNKCSKNNNTGCTHPKTNTMPAGCSPETCQSVLFSKKCILK
jgi:hypothetical protein